jgi:hypothetical protein
VHVLGWPGETLRLPCVKHTYKSARRLNGGEVQWKQTDGELEIAVPANQRDPLDTIVELTTGQ